MSSMSLLIFSMLQGCVHLQRAKITHQLDNLVVMHTSRPIYGTADIGQIRMCRTLYRHYQDVFDLIFMVANVPHSEQDIDKIGFYGWMGVVRNSTLGVGTEIFDDGGIFRSDAALKGVLYFPARELFIRGPTLHEIMHLWVYDIEIIPTVVESHWGFSDVNGQLGGFDRKTLTELGPNTYSAGKFGTVANFGNTVPFSPLELYLGGWITAEDVPEILVFEDGQWVKENGTIKEDDQGNFVFTGTTTSHWPIERIVERLGERVPNHKASQKAFRAAVILVGNDEYPVTDEDIEFLSKHIDLFTRTESIRTVEDFERVYNFWEATGGRATLNANNLNQALLNPKETETEADPAKTTNGGR